jgi:hypothetical protein
MTDNDISPAWVRSRALLTPWLVALAILSSVVVMAYRFFALINTYAVNLLYFDQWDFYGPLFREQGFWELFSFQHGPHRQGLGSIVIQIVAGLTAWNSRADAFTVGAIIASAMLAAFYLKRRLFGELTLADAIIPLIFLTIAQYESLVITPNPAHGALPLLLVLSSALAWGLQPALARYTAIIILNFLLIFTGFGLFMGLITPALLALDAFQQARTDRGNAWVPPLVALALALMSIYLFTIGYVFQPAITCFEFPHQRPWEYPWFVGLMLARFLGVSYDPASALASILGCTLIILMVGVLAYHLFILIRSGVRARGTSTVIAILIGYSLLFCMNTAIGRICAGMESSQASRYLTLLIPAFFGLYLHILTLCRMPVRYVALALCIALLLPLPLQAKDAKLIQGFTEGKQRWKACHLETERIDHCGRVSGLTIYPAPPELKARLAYLKQHQLNLFAEQPAQN